MAKIITDERFQKAQSYESEYWSSRQHDPVGIVHDLESPFMLAQHLQRSGYLKMTFHRLLDVGVGGLGLGLLWLVEAREKHGLDPLPVLRPETGCSVMDAFVNSVQSAATYTRAAAETMPYENEYFDVIICNNVLDHVKNPFSILNEIKRCLSPGGLFAFAVDTESYLGLLQKRMMKRVNPDYGSLPGHPYEWTESEMSAILTDQINLRVESHVPRPQKGRYLGRRHRSTWLLRKP